MPMTDTERVIALLRAGLNEEAIAAVLGAEVADIHKHVLAADDAPALGIVPTVQGALNSGDIVVPGSAPSFVAHDYVSDGDTNGIFYALGAEGGSFLNPARSGGPVVASESGILAPWEPPPHATYLTDRDSTVNIFHSSAAGANWAMWDFGTGHSVKVREYTVKSRWDSSVAWPSHWKLQGSHDSVAWTDLDEVASPGFTALDQWRHFACDNVPADTFRYIRLIDTTDTYLVLGEVELYGDLYT
jgi:hypothetical protein